MNLLRKLFWLSSWSLLLIKLHGLSINKIAGPKWKTTEMLDLTNSSLAPGPCSYPASLGLASSYSTSTLLLPEEICSTLNHPCCCPDDFGLVPLVLWVEQLPLVARDVCPLLHQHCEWLLVRFQYLDFKVVWETLVFVLSSMWVHQMFEKCWFRSNLFTFAVEFGNLLFWPAVHVLGRLEIFLQIWQELIGFNLCQILLVMIASQYQTKLIFNF